MKAQITKEIFDFFIESDDYNGISLTALAEKLGIEYHALLPYINELVNEKIISLQSGENPHIIRFGHYSIDEQIKFLQEAEDNEIKIVKSINLPDGNTLNIRRETHTVCAYPTPSYLEKNRDTSDFNLLPFSKRLALGKPQVSSVFFELDVLERYFNDPRYIFEFDDYSGHISYAENTTFKEHDQVFLQTFGLGYNQDKNRVVVVYLRYLDDLSAEHQVYWKSKEITSPCKIVGEYYENTVLGNWTSSNSVFSAFIEEQRLINELSKIIKGKSLFRKTFEGHNRPKEFTFFTSPTLKNYENFVSLLDKMISDNINKDFFSEDLELFKYQEVDGFKERKEKGTLQLLEEWLRQEIKLKNEEGYEVLMNPLRKVRKERQNPAHKISKDYYDQELFKKQMDLLKDVYYSMNGLRCILNQDPSVKDYEIPRWIKEGKIKAF